MTGWNPVEVTVSPPQTITVSFSREGAIDGQATYTTSDTTTTIFSTQSVEYVDSEGLTQRLRIISSKVEETTTSLGKVNPSYVSSALAAGLTTAIGSAVTSRIATVYNIKVTPSGPYLESETVTTEISLAELAGRLSVPSYASYFPGNQQITSSILETVYFTTWSLDGPITRSTTVGRTALGLTQAGQQAFAEQMRQRTDLDFATAEGGSFISAVVNSMAALVSQGAETRDESGTPAVPLQPLESEIARDSINESDTGQRTTTALLASDSDLNVLPTTTRIYEMPFAPDDFYSWEEP
jgi:hypothetical protein